MPYSDIHVHHILHSTNKSHDSVWVFLYPVFIIIFYVCTSFSSVVL